LRGFGLEKECMLNFIKRHLVAKKLVILIILALGCWQFGSGTYIYAKAQVAQLMLNHAWSKTLKGEKKVTPWDWADTYPVAKISFAKHNKNYIILAGGTGRTMAFGPGHVSSSSLPGQGGNSVIVGHRDTHFSILQNLEHGDIINIQLENKNLSYTVADSFIVDKYQSEVMQEHGSEMLTLITCYPFNAMQAGSRLRYIVQAIQTRIL